MYRYHPCFDMFVFGWFIVDRAAHDDDLVLGEAVFGFCKMHI